MPLYEYRCDACGVRFEQIRKFSDPPVEVCPSCGERKVQKLVSSPAIQFKGSGFYITDYARKGATGDAADKPAAKDAKDAKGSSSDSNSGSSSSGSTDAASTPAPASAPAATPSKDS